MRRARTLAIGAVVVTVAMFVGVSALADDPDGTLQQARDLLAQADSLIAAEQAKPPIVTTVTQTVTATITETVTASPTQPPSSCEGVSVSPGSGTLKAAMDARPAGATYCLSAGTYGIPVKINIPAGADNVLVGAGQSQTFLDGSGLDPNRSIMFVVRGTMSVRDLDIGGAPVPAAAGTCRNPNDTGLSNAACGKAFVAFGDLELVDVTCHDNGGNCVSNGGNLVATRLDCYGNGSAYSMTSSFRYAACVKFAGYSLDETDRTGNITMRDSTIHDNPWVGVWCDFCRGGVVDVRGTVFEGNGKGGIQYEVSGGWTAGDHAVVIGNTFTGNNTIPDSLGAGVIVSTSQDIEVSGNTFTNNTGAAVRIIYTQSRVDTIADWSFKAERNVVIGPNTITGAGYVGCGITGVTCQ